MPEYTTPTPASSALSAQTKAAATVKLRQTLCATLPQFFDREGVFLRDKFDAALRTAGITESGHGMDASGKKAARHFVPHAGQSHGANDNTGGTLPGLTKRQREILGLLRSGHSHKDMAYELGISHATVRATVCALRKRLGPERVPLLRRGK
jgi:hypothetical protein